LTARLPVVGVMGSAKEGHPELAVPLGTWLASLPVHLLTGAGAGVMGEVSRAFARCSPRRGLVIGIVPSRGAGDPNPKDGYPNEWVELAIFTHLYQLGDEGQAPLSRNHLNILSSDVIIALPGGQGTRSEVALALRYDRPVVAFMPPGRDDPGLPQDVPRARTLDEVKAFVRTTLEFRA
jgi:uncharacterized protein (TIGR00725 family)